MFQLAFILFYYLYIILILFLDLITVVYETVDISAGSCDFISSNIFISSMFSLRLEKVSCISCLLSIQRSISMSNNYIIEISSWNKHNTVEA